MAGGFNYAPGSSTDVAKAAQPDLTREQMMEFAASRNAVVRESLAGRADLTISVTAALANDDAADVRAALAANSSVSVAVLEMLSEDRQRSVVVAVAGNPSTPVAVLEALALHRRSEISSAARETLDRVVGGARAAEAPAAPALAQIFPSAQADPVLQESVPPSPPRGG